jgi:hypothetical protein
MSVSGMYYPTNQGFPVGMQTQPAYGYTMTAPPPPVYDPYAGQAAIGYPPAGVGGAPWGIVPQMSAPPQPVTYSVVNPGGPYTTSSPNAQLNIPVQPGVQNTVSTSTGSQGPDAQSMEMILKQLQEQMQAAGMDPNQQAVSATMPPPSQNIIQDERGGYHVVGGSGGKSHFFRNIVVSLAIIGAIAGGIWYKFKK